MRIIQTYLALAEKTDESFFDSSTIGSCSAALVVVLVYLVATGDPRLQER